MAKKERKKSTFFADFKKFISRGNVVDMAVGVVIGGAFGKIVTGFVNYVINPFVALFIKSGSLDDIKTIIKPEVTEVVDSVEKVVTAEVAILWGTWLQTIIDFLIIALCIFIMVRIISAISAKANAKKLAAKAEEDRIAAEKAAAADAAAAEAAAAKAAEDAALRASILAQTELLTEIRDSLKK